MEKNISSNNIFVERMNGVIRFFLYAIMLAVPFSTAGIEFCVTVAMFFWLLKRMGMMVLEIQKESKQSLWSTLRIMSQAFLPSHTVLNPLIFIFLVVGLLSSIFGVMPAESIRSLFLKTFEWFLLFWLVVETFTKKKHLRVCLYVLTTSVIVISMDAIIQFIWLKKDIFLGMAAQEGFRATAAFTTANGLGAYLAFSIPLMGGLFLSSPQKRKIFKIASVLMVFLALIFTFSRGSWISICMGAIVFMLYMFIRMKIKSITRWGIMVALMFGLVGVGVGLTKYGDINYIKNSGTWSVRFRIWIDSLEMVRDRPWLGSGPNTYMRVFQSYRRDPQFGGTYAHNSFLQLLCDFGIIGFGVFSMLVYKFFKTSFNVFRRCFMGHWEMEFLLGGCLVGLIVFYLHSMVDNHFFSLKLSTMWWYVTGIVLAIITNMSSDFEIEKIEKL